MRIKKINKWGLLNNERWVTVSISYLQEIFAKSKSVIEKVNEVITSATFVISATFTSVLLCQPANEVVPKNSYLKIMQGSTTTRLEIKYETPLESYRLTTVNRERERKDMWCTRRLQVSVQLFTWRKVKAYLVHWHMSRQIGDSLVVFSTKSVAKMFEKQTEANESNSLAAFT